MKRLLFLFLIVTANVRIYAEFTNSYSNNSYIDYEEFKQELLDKFGEGWINNEIKKRSKLAEKK